MTINEPAVTVVCGYITGIFPPFEHFSLARGAAVLSKLVQAHDVAAEEIKDGLKRDQPQVGVGYNWQFFEGIGGTIGSLLQRYCTARLERNGEHSDFIGLHYYYRYTSPLRASERALRDFSDQPTFGDVYPCGILPVLREMHRAYPQKPIFVSEFGFSDALDLRRPYWILETLRHILKAKQEGIPVKGILYWTLGDNFEWNFGMSLKIWAF